MITQSRLTELLQRRKRQRKIQRPKLPSNAERMYLGAMRSYADVLIGEMKEALQSAGLHLDAVDRLKTRRAQERIPLDRIFGEVLAHGKRDAKRVVGLTSEELVAGHLLNTWRAENVRLITNFSEEMLQRIEQLIQSSYGTPVGDLADSIEGTFDMTRSRAELIARDQTLKLNAQVGEQAQRQAGVSQYIWSTSQDESVRDTHADLEGELCSWDSPPVVDKHGNTAHPGLDYQCRCVAIPYLPELADLY